MPLSFPQKGLREVRGCLHVLSDPASSPWKKKKKLIIKNPFKKIPAAFSAHFFSLHVDYPLWFQSHKKISSHF